MGPSSPEFKSYVRGLQILHFAMMAGVIMTLLVLKFFVGIQKISANPTMLYTFIGVAMFAMLLYFILYKKKIEAAKSFKGTTSEKLAHYREAFVFKLATFEGPALVGTIFHYLDGNPILLYGVLAFIVMLFLQRPTEENIIEELALKF